MMWMVTLAVCFLIYFLPLVLPKTCPIRYYSCYVCYVATLLTLSLIAFPLLMLMPSQVDSLVIYGAMFISKVIGIEWEVRNTDFLKKYKKAVVIYNHQSLLDFLGGMRVFLPHGKYSIVMKESLKYLIPFSQAMILLNASFISRKNNRKRSMEIMKEKVERKNCSLVISPEGTRNYKGEPLLPFKKGAFRIAMDFKIPILPFVISPYYFVAPGRFTGGKVILSFLEPVEMTNIDEEGLEDFIERTKSLMEKEYAKLKAEVMANIEEDKTK